MLGTVAPFRGSAVDRSSQNYRRSATPPARNSQPSKTLSRSVSQEEADEKLKLTSSRLICQQQKRMRRKLSIGQVRIVLQVKVYN